MARNKSIRSAVEADLSTLLRLMTPRQMGTAWRGALVASARKVRKEAVKGFRASGLHNSGRMLKAFRFGARRDLAGFYVKISSAKKHPGSYHVNRYGKAKPVVLWADTGTSNRLRRGGKGDSRYSTGTTPAHRFMDKARALLPAVCLDLEKQVQKRAAKAAAKTIRQYYGRQ